MKYGGIEFVRVTVRFVAFSGFFFAKTGYTLARARLCDGIWILHWSERERTARDDLMWDFQDDSDLSWG